MIHLIERKDKIVVDQQFYDIYGQETTRSDQLIYAVSSQTDNGINKYYILYNTYGPDAGKPVNPMTVNDTANQNRYNSKMGKKKEILQAVSEQKFNLYIKFLKTKNSGYLRELERIQ